MVARLTFLAVRVVMLSWEYPPLVVGGLGRHVESLSRELVRAGHEVHVITRGEKDEIVDEIVDGVHVRRAALDPLAIDFTTESLLAWAQASEHSLLRAALPIVRRRRPDVVHAHDWLVAQSSVTLAATTRRPLVATMHATEAGRHQGWLPAPLNLAIHSVERWLARTADEVITCSRPGQAETAELFELDPASVHVVPNGVDVDRWRSTARQRAELRSRHAGAGPLVVYAGRLVHEKGVQTLLSAVRPLRERHAGLRLVVAGAGTREEALHEQARSLRIARAVDWMGFVPGSQVATLFGAADVAVVPSLYEPFGIVALEAAAAGTPVAAATTGGLADLIDDHVATASFAPGDVAALVDAVDAVLTDPAAARRSVARARRVLARDYTWAAVAERTVRIYDEAVGRNDR
jgi:glycogen(starch) synthase